MTWLQIIISVRKTIWSFKWNLAETGISCSYVFWWWSQIT